MTDRSEASQSVRDVVVVGGGAAGLAAVARLLATDPERDVLLLEEGDRLGGRLRSDPFDDGGWINLGAHLLTGGRSHIAEFVAESGLDVLRVPGVKSALWFGDRLHVRRRAEAYPLVLPLTLRERAALVRIGLTVRVLAEGWRRAARRRPNESWSQHRRRFATFQAKRTFADVLGDAPDRVAAIFRAAARRSAGEADDLTAGAALSIFGALWVGAASDSVANISGGSGRLGEIWQTRLGARAALRTRVTAVVERADHVEMTYIRDGQPGVERARQVIVAVPAPLAAQLLSGLPAQVYQELADVAYGAFVCVGVRTGDLGPCALDDVYAISTPGLAFDMLFHHSSSVRPVPGRKSLMAYAGGRRAAALLDASDDEIRHAFETDMAEVLPEIRDHVQEIVVQRWRYGNCYATPGSRLDEVIAWNERAGARVLLAGDYFAALGGTVEAATASGNAAAKRIVAARATSAVTPIDAANGRTT